MTLVGLLLLVVVADLLALWIWRAVTNRWPTPRLRGRGLVVALGTALAVALLATFAPDVVPWDIDRSAVPGQLPFVILLQLALAGLVYLRGVQRPFYREAAKNPDARDEKRSPLEHTADGGDFLCDVVDLTFGSTRPPGQPIDGEPRLIDEPNREGMRVAHAHGSGAAGYFLLDPAAGELSDAWVFQHSKVEVRARFSNFNAHTERRDEAKGPRGLAVRLVPPSHPSHPNPSSPSNPPSGLPNGLPNGPLSGLGPVDILGISMDRFMTRTREDFVSFSRAMSRPALSKILWILYLLITGRTRTKIIHHLLVSKAPESYAEPTYHGINAFWFVRSGHEGSQGVGGGDERRTPVRYRFDPVPPHSDRPPTERGTDGRHLHRELAARLAGERDEIRFEVSVVIGQGLTPAQINDPLVRWPRRCPTQRLGTLVLTEVDPDVHALAFDPHHLCSGIEPSDDEILMARRAAYPTSVLRRRPPIEPAEPAPEAAR